MEKSFNLHKELNVLKRIYFSLLRKFGSLYGFSANENESYSAL